jgi:uncharacterized cofD-like protein
VAVSDGPITTVCLDLAEVPGYPPALEALESADVIVIGPGSLFTSILPNFLVDGVIDAVSRSNATVVYVCNVGNLRGETSGMDAADHVDALVRHGLDGLIDIALVDSSEASADAAGVSGGPAVVERIERQGIRVIAADLAGAENPMHHDADRLYAALAGVW